MFTLVKNRSRAGEQVIDSSLRIDQVIVDQRLEPRTDIDRSGGAGINRLQPSTVPDSILLERDYPVSVGPRPTR